MLRLLHYDLMFFSTCRLLLPVAIVDWLSTPSIRMLLRTCIRCLIFPEGDGDSLLGEAKIQGPDGTQTKPFLILNPQWRGLKPCCMNRVQATLFLTLIIWSNWQLRHTRVLFGLNISGKLIIKLSIYDPIFLHQNRRSRDPYKTVLDDGLHTNPGQRNPWISIF